MADRKNIFARADPGSARASRAVRGAPAANFLSGRYAGVFGGGAEHCTRGRVRSPERKTASRLIYK